MNGVSRLKLIDAGVPADTIALLTAPLLPFLILVPIALSRFLIGQLAMRTFIATYILKYASSTIQTLFAPLPHETSSCYILLKNYYVAFIRLIFGIAFAALIFFTPFVKDEENGIPAWYYWLLLFMYNAHAVG